MARYTVNVAARGRRASLLVVLSPSQLCSALHDRVKSRLPALATKLGLTDAKQPQITLHLERNDGPMLNLEELLSDVLPDPKETVYAVVDIHEEQSASSIPPQLATSGRSTKTLHIRVITPESAQSRTNVVSLISTPVSTKCTLKHLKGIIQEHLGFPTEEGACPALECNCSFARNIDDNAVLNVDRTEDHDALHTAILVHSNNVVVAIPVDDNKLSTIQRAMNSYMERILERKLSDKFTNVLGGVVDTGVQLSGDKSHLKLPIMANCSERCHSHRQDQGRQSGHDAAQRALVVDIHTSECPLEITAHNADITIEAARLEDCAVNGILDIYAVQRWKLGQNERVDQGKAGIFKKSESWEHHIGQTDRGLASLLSTLRVFTELTGDQSMVDGQRDSVLHMIHLLTQFPPAVRAAHILMRGETPGLPERAALAQCLYEVLKSVVPLQTVRSDPKRFFEGSRLLFGLILEKAKNMKINLGENSTLPYIGMKVYDLRNLITMHPVLSESVQTMSGLVDRPLQSGLNSRLNMDRIAKVSGGTRTQVLVFDPDAVRTSSRYVDSNDVKNVISPAEYVDLTYLANLCSRNQLSVIPPARLASASAPVLTLDRDGFLAVYVGRAGCAEAGRDILMFRPASMSEEEAVDVSIITQLLEPILAQRKADGSIVFEAYGDSHRKLTAPDETTMICVDLSSSMDERCGFDDIQNSEDAEEEMQEQVRSTVAPPQAPVEENSAFDLPGPDELKEYIRSHESYDDFIAIVGTGKDDYHRRQNAKKVFEILKQLHDQRIESKRKQLEGLRPGEAIPKLHKTLPTTESPGFEVPPEYHCPISSNVMEDPVTTVDGFTYERKEIERWLRFNERSPFTNLILPSNDLRPNVHMQEQITAYMNGSDIMAKYTQSGNRTRPSSSTMRITFRSPLETRSMGLPRELKVADLWEIAFRLTKGRYTSYELRHRDVRIPETQELAVNMINAAYEVFITALESTASSTNNGLEELCLIKVYRNHYQDSVVSYWTPKQTTKSLASAVFRHYRQRFMDMSTYRVEQPFIFWTRLHDTRDNHIAGTPVYDHWRSMAPYFNSTDSTGKLATESVVDKNSNDDVSDDTDHKDPAPGTRPLVFKVFLGGSPRSSKKRDTLSRLDVLKQMFDAYVNRLLAYNFQTHLGLVTFSNKSSLSQKITNAFEQFRHKLNKVKASGDTAIWDSIALAQDQLLEYAKQYPKAKLRIICISDGEDNKSKIEAHSLPSSLYRSGIVVDSFCLGDESDNADLKSTSYLVGWYVFQPNSLEEAMAICEMEPVLSLSERPDKAPKNTVYHRNYLANPGLYSFRVTQEIVKVEKVSRHELPDRKQHPQLAEPFVELGHFNKVTATNRTGDTVRLSRIHNEIRNSGAKPHLHYDVYISESNMGLWKDVMQGPDDSTYAGGAFLLYLEMGNNYPMSPPEARFITPIYHPNINRHDLIDTIYLLLLVPEFSDPISTVVTLNYHWDEVQFKEDAQRHIEKHASKSRESWRNEIVGQAE
ncbi:hypothetical protein GT037_007669 [Alternaria burnsii]|uniref:peptidylprolyl isomerase n=1 Tax=Alternaria burnsii TaxID=1187904 RepID=A0A8H7B2P1_9PLEO|nr:uncharacterized protein GT037_007669 [Alternaria burnsii]KAF7673903.1 hypothetical protein GT037_007669 [Alternaria burnsii]